MKTSVRKLKKFIKEILSEDKSVIVRKLKLKNFSSDEIKEFLPKYQKMLSFAIRSGKNDPETFAFDATMDRFIRKKLGDQADPDFEEAGRLPKKLFIPLKKTMWDNPPLKK